MSILVTGGAGYIGSHTCIELLKNGYEIIIADNLSNSKYETIDKIKLISDKSLDFYEIDITEEKDLESIFSENKIEAVIHFAGFKAVGESVREPLKYYYNNLLSTILLVKMCKKYNIKKFIFSSSATVYGDNEIPFNEEMNLLETTNPYGETKAMCERILMDIAKVDSDFDLTLLRYFNPIGAHKSGLIGEVPNGTPNNLMPYITKVAKGKLDKLYIYGDDYPTVDGTGVRDYIHVMDLAEGHVAALKNKKVGINIYNLGTGKGTSVLELLNAFKDINSIDVPYEIVARRPGDIAECYADVSKAKRELNWKSKRDIFEMCKDAWNFEKNNL